MIDHGFRMAHTRGNTGRGFKLGIVDVPPIDRHELRMGVIAREVVPDAEILWGEAVASHPQELWRLAVAGCSCIAMPFVLPDLLTKWQSYLSVLRTNGVLLFGSTGNGVPTTMFPAIDPNVIACGTVAPDGTAIDKWSSRSGKRQVGVVAGEDASSGAAVSAAAQAILWVAYAVHTHPHPAHRHPGYLDWLSRTGTPLAGGGHAPDCSNL